MEFMIRHDGREFGPYSEPELTSRLRAGTIALSDQALVEGATEWAPLSSFVGAVVIYGAVTLACFHSDYFSLTNIAYGSRAMAIFKAEFGTPLSGELLRLMARHELGVIVPVAMFASWRDFYWAWLLLIIPVGLILSAAITVKTSELVITDRRVLIKVGFIQRHTFEMFISKIESVAVFQSMLGRLFNYGTVEIRGTGGSSESFATIAAPLRFRDAIQLVQSSSERR